MTWTLYLESYCAPQLYPRGATDGKPGFRPFKYVFGLGTCLHLVAYDTATGEAWYEIDRASDRSLEVFEKQGGRIAEAA